MKFPACWEVPTVHEGHCADTAAIAASRGPPHIGAAGISTFFSDANSLVVPGCSTSSLTRDKRRGTPVAFFSRIEDGSR
jgi:hypothetical protein